MIVISGPNQFRKAKVESLIYTVITPSPPLAAYIVLPVFGARKHENLAENTQSPCSPGSKANKHPGHEVRRRGGGRKGDTSE